MALPFIGKELWLTDGRRRVRISNGFGSDPPISCHPTTQPLPAQKHWWVRGPVTVWQPINMWGWSDFSNWVIWCYMVTPQEIEAELNLPLFCDILMAVSRCSHLSASFFWGSERWFVPTNARNVAAELNACTRPWKACKARVGSFRSCQQLWNRIYIIYIIT